LGTVFPATTAGTTAEDEGEKPRFQVRGDELDLYAEFHFELVKKIQRDVRPISQDNAEDACAFAWLQFLRKQPDRHGERWKGWLYTAAKHEAWRLNALEFKEREDVSRDTVVDLFDPVDPRDRISERIEFHAALQELQKLPPMLQEVVMIRSQVTRQQEVADIMGLSRQRVAQLLVKAALRVAQLNEERHDEERPVASPRAARLRELEDHPPTWLTNALGREPGRSKSDSAVVLAWRRAAIFIDDFRRDHGWSSATNAIGATPLDPAARLSYQRAERAIADVAGCRERRKNGIQRER
jgi:RNA polymerase sigma factor (sigma-70 family)